MSVAASFVGKANKTGGTANATGEPFYSGKSKSLGYYTPKSMDTRWSEVAYGQMCIAATPGTMHKPAHGGSPTVAVVWAKTYWTVHVAVC